MVSSDFGKLDVRRQRISVLDCAMAGAATALPAAARPAPCKKALLFMVGVFMMGVSPRRGLIYVPSSTEKVVGWPMKLASLKQGRDGRLVMVSRDLTRATDAFFVVPTLQAALDDWGRDGPLLADLAEQLEHGSVPSFRFHEHECASPLPRAYQWADGSAYVNHVELVRKAGGAESPASFWTDPLIYQGGSDSFLGPRDPIRMADEGWGIDMEGEVAVVTGDVPMGISPQDARLTIRLVML